MSKAPTQCCREREPWFSGIIDDSDRPSSSSSSQRGRYPTGRRIARRKTPFFDGKRCPLRFFMPFGEYRKAPICHK